MRIAVKDKMYLILAVELHFACSGSKVNYQIPLETEKFELLIENSDFKCRIPPTSLLNEKAGASELLMDAGYLLPPPEMQ